MNDKDKKKYDEYLQKMMRFDAEIQKLTHEQNKIILNISKIEEKYRQKKQ